MQILKKVIPPNYQRQKRYIYLYIPIIKSKYEKIKKKTVISVT